MPATKTAYIRNSDRERIDKKHAMIELRQTEFNMSRDADEYFSLYASHLPCNLGQDQTILLHRIDNIGVIRKIIQVNPNARYTIYGNALLNNALRALKNASSEASSIEGFIDSGYLFNDKRLVDDTKFNYSVFWRNPRTRDKTTFSMLGIKPGDKLVFKWREVEGDCVVIDDRHVKCEEFTGTLTSIEYNMLKKYNVLPRCLGNPFDLYFKGDKTIRSLRLQYDNDNLLVVHNF